jgi:SAM-dependent methyltransferase
VLVVGAGQGLEAVVLAKLGAHVTAIDVSEASLFIAKERAAVNGVSGQVHTIACDAGDLPLMSESVDSIFAPAVMHHVEVARAAVEIRRVLRVGGPVVFIEPIEAPRWLARVKHFLPSTGDATEDERPLTAADFATISSVIGAAERLRAFGFVARLVERFAPRYAPPFIYHLDSWAFRRFPSLAVVGSPYVWLINKVEPADRPKPREYKHVVGVLNRD